ncbi:hypothetical protein DM01DRAFT_1379004 [Hesseltinella vesiculosa]|uniref:Endonuclease/exonuclease/phosphatase domain-containing protein n=1 Tax=Hesseltinella vesiculosa TaxID=101127 RepID=A0A1X2G2F1_9FUNG|nr:hypothetical protein DM01DRAFT_1379004 [Hesseltinella vesiculosa]
MEEDYLENTWTEDVHHEVDTQEDTELETVGLTDPGIPVATPKPSSIITRNATKKMPNEDASSASSKRKSTLRDTRGLLKLTSASDTSTTAKQVSTFIHSQELAADIVCLQEIKLASANNHLKTTSTVHFFTKHVGIIILNKHLEVKDTFVSLDQRTMFIKVYHRQTQQSLTVVNVYGPATASRDENWQEVQTDVSKAIWAPHQADDELLAEVAWDMLILWR